MGKDTNTAPIKDVIMKELASGEPVISIQWPVLRTTWSVQWGFVSVYMLNRLVCVCAQFCGHCVLGIAGPL